MYNCDRRREYVCLPLHRTCILPHIAKLTPKLKPIGRWEREATSTALHFTSPVWPLDILLAIPSRARLAIMAIHAHRLGDPSKGCRHVRSTQSHVALMMNPCPVQRTIVTSETSILGHQHVGDHTGDERQSVEAWTMIWFVPQVTDRYSSKVRSHASGTRTCRISPLTDAPASII